VYKTQQELPLLGRIQCIKTSIYKLYEYKNKEVMVKVEEAKCDLLLWIISAQRDHG